MRAKRSVPRPATSKGRPSGSVRLTEAIEQEILAYIRAGAFDYVAAEAAGVGARTFREWIARGEGRHPTRDKTKRLQAFAAAVRRAQAQVRVAKEIEIAKLDPRYWLSHQGRSRPGREGWTEPVAGDGKPADLRPAALPLADIVQAVQGLVDAGAIPSLRCKCGHACDAGGTND